MKKFLDNLYKNQSLVYKGFLFVLTAAVVVYLFPKGGKFKYDFHKGKLWQYETLYAPFDFAIYKTDQQYQADRVSVTSNHPDYFKYYQGIKEVVYKGFEEKFQTFFSGESRSQQLYSQGLELLNDIYEKGVVENNLQYVADQVIS